MKEKRIITLPKFTNRSHVFLDRSEAAVPGPEGDFFLNRRWGYVSRQGGPCLEYRLDHPPWQAFRCRIPGSMARVGDYYGPPFTAILAREPDSAFSSTGSRVSLSWRRRCK